MYNDYFRCVKLRYKMSQWASKFSILRFWNLFLLFFSYYLSRIIRKPIHWGLPFHVSIEPTTACNLGCPECPSGLKSFTRPTGKINMNQHEHWLDQLAPTVFYITYYFQGEPFLHPQFLNLIKAAKQRKIYTATSTNSHFIDDKKAEEVIESGLDQIIISIDGITQAVYEQYRVHGQLTKVLSGTQALVTTRCRMKSQTPKIIWQCLAVKPNEHEIPQIFELGKSMGVDEVRIKTAQLYEYENGNPLMPENNQYSRYKINKVGKYELKNSGGNHCWRMWSGAVISWDGQVVPCCFDKDAKHAFGELNSQGFKEIYKGNISQQFRKKVLKERETIDICTNCSEGSKVWL